MNRLPSALTRCAPDAADLLGDEQAEYLLRVGRAGRVVLDGVDERELRPGPVREHQPVRGRAVVVGAGEALDVQPAAAAGRNNRRLRPDGEVLLGLEVDERRAGAGAVLVGQQFDRRAVLEQLQVRGCGTRRAGCA